MTTFRKDCITLLLPCMVSIQANLLYMLKFGQQCSYNCISPIFCIAFWFLLMVTLISWMPRFCYLSWSVGITTSLKIPDRTLLHNSKLERFFSIKVCKPLHRNEYGVCYYPSNNSYLCLLVGQMSFFVIVPQGLKYSLVKCLNARISLEERERVSDYIALERSVLSNHS